MRKIFLRYTITADAETMLTAFNDLLRQRTVDKSITLEQYVEIWRREIAPHKLAKSTLARDDQNLAKILPHLGHYKLTESTSAATQ